MSLIWLTEILPGIVSDVVDVAPTIVGDAATDSVSSSIVAAPRLAAVPLA